MTLTDLLDRVASGEVLPSEAEQLLESWSFVELGYNRIDTHRERRTALPEVVFGLSKSEDQLREIFSWFVERNLPLLATKVDPSKAAALQHALPAVEYSPAARLLRCGTASSRASGSVVVISAGSSDLQVAEEASGTLEFFGIEATRLYDCGVAGLHRLFAGGELIASSSVAIVVAGMEGALPSVVGGIFGGRPLIAVPTSVGYGSSFEGLAALLGMLNSCAPGVTVVNIDNGFGAAVAAKAILEIAGKRTDREPVIEKQTI